MGEYLLESYRASAGALTQARAHGQPLVLHIQTLGVPEVRLGDVPLHFPTKKALALLLYLAVTGTPQPREQLAALFWPDRDDERARATLRSTLRLLRQTLVDASVAPASDPRDPGASRGGRVAAQPTDLFVRGGHDRLGRDCLWLERSAATAAPSSGALSAGGNGSVATIHVELDLDVLEHAATLAARLSAQLAAARTDTFAGGEHVGGERGSGAVGHGAAGDTLRQPLHPLQQLTSAMGVCRGSYLAGFTLEDSDTFSAWVEQQRVYWHGRMDRVFEALSRLQLEHGAFAAARETAARWVDRNALEEAGYRRLMEAHAAAGDRAAALAAYARCRETLSRTLGVEPAPETVALAERLRRQAPGSERSAAAGSGAGIRARGAPTVAAAPEAHPAVPVPHPTATVPHNMPHKSHVGDPKLLTLPLVGREAEFATLVAAGERARQGTPVVVVLEGATGIGKTRLSVEFLRWAAQTRGAEVLQGQAFEAGGRLPYQPLVEALRRRLEHERAPDDLLDDVWLAELSRLLPELRERYPDLPPPLEEASGAQARLFEAVAQLGLALARRLRASGARMREGMPDGAPGAPLLLFLDDVHWTDVGTRDLVHFVVRRWREAGVPALVLLTVRREDLCTRDELRAWLRDLAHEVRETGMSTVALHALGADTVHRLLEDLAVADVADVQDVAGASADVDMSARGSVQAGDDGDSTDFALPATSTLEVGLQGPSRATSQTQTVAQLAEWLYAETGGQPLYLVQLLRTLLEQGVLALEERDAAQPSSAATGLRTSPCWRLRVNVSPQEIANLGQLLPASMRAVIRQRLERLSASTRHFLMAGAVLGTRFQPAQAWALADLDEAAGLDALEEAERQLVIQIESLGSAGEICHFTHDKLHEVLYTEIGAVRRRVLHRRAYELLARKGERATPAELAHHALQAGLREPRFHTNVAAGEVA